MQLLVHFFQEVHLGLIGEEGGLEGEKSHFGELLQRKAQVSMGQPTETDSIPA